MTENFVTAWKYLVKPQCVSAFVERYSSSGTWVKLFQKSDAYSKTILLKTLAHSNEFVTLDFWKSRDAYQKFIAENRSEYAAIDSACDALTLSEEKIGEWISFDAQKE